jgi:hypothetical protein
MGTTVRIWQVEAKGAASDPDLPETRRASIALDTREVDLDQSWTELGGVLESLGLENPFEEEEISGRDLKRMAKTLEQLPFPKLLALTKELGCPIDDPEYIEPYFNDFRETVLNAAKCGYVVAIEFA